MGNGPGPCPGILRALLYARHMQRAEGAMVRGLLVPVSRRELPQPHIPPEKGCQPRGRTGQVRGVELLAWTHSTIHLSGGTEV